MIRSLARMAAYCVVLIPVLAFSGDIDGRQAFNALWPRVLVIVVVLGVLHLAIDRVYGREPSVDCEEQPDEPHRPPPNPALWGLCIALVMVAVVVLLVQFWDDPWMQATVASSPALLACGSIAVLLLLAKHFDRDEP